MQIFVSALLKFVLKQNEWNSVWGAHVANMDAQSLSRLFWKCSKAKRTKLCLRSALFSSHLYSGCPENKKNWEKRIKLRWVETAGNSHHFPSVLIFDLKSIAIELEATFAVLQGQTQTRVAQAASVQPISWLERKTWTHGWRKSLDEVLAEQTT